MSGRIKLNSWLVIPVMLLGFGSTIAAGDIIYVDANRPTGSDGATWGTAYKYLQDALDDAESGDEIWVAAGIYRPDDDDASHPNGSGDRTATFQLINGVAIYGSYAGLGADDPNERDIDAYESILSGDIGTEGVSGDNSYHVVTGSGTNGTAVLDGFTITTGNANGPSPHNNGGGMYNYSGSPTITNCTFSENGALLGGGMLNSDSSPTVTNCTFSGNRADISGGGMWNYESSPTITNCTFIGNSTGWNGGGMLNSDSSPTLTNCTFSGNSADEHGGGMYNYESSPMLANCTFSGNSAGINGGGMYTYYYNSPTVTNCTFSGNSAGINGGGMYNWDNSNPTVTNCIFKGNTSNWHGGGMCNAYGSNATLTNCIFSRNSTTYHGGGIYNYWQSSATLTNCTFTENLAGFGGGGMMNTDNSSPKLTNCVFGGNSATIHGGGGVENWNNSSPTLTNCTFTGNSAEWGGGMYNWNNSSPTVTNCIFTGNLAESGGGMYNLASSPTLTNCILWGDTPEEIYPYGAYWEITYSDVQGGWPGLGNIDADPCFADPCNGDYHLKSEGWRWDPNLYRSSDFTQDGIVNFKDFANLAGFWLFEASNLPVDLNRDGAVNLEDLSIFSKKFLTSGSTGGWTFDSVTSRCIDAGNPGSPLGDELMSVPDDPCNIWGENIRINMGAYGGTAEASMPPYDWAILADLTNDGIVDYIDLGHWVENWLSSDRELPSDLDRNGVVDMFDFALFGQDWPIETSWR